jgi:hypothetical protein
MMKESNHKRFSRSVFGIEVGGCFRTALLSRGLQVTQEILWLRPHLVALMSREPEKRALATHRSLKRSIHRLLLARRRRQF